MIHNYSGVFANLSAEALAPIQRRRKMSSAEAIWYLYGLKGGFENHYKDYLDDLALHYPPCQEHARNAGFYALGALAGLLAKAVQLLAGPWRPAASSAAPTPAAQARPSPAAVSPTPSATPTAHSARRRAESPSMRLWRFRRRLLTLPARIAYHARTVKTILLGVCNRVRREFEHYWGACCRC